MMGFKTFISVWFLNFLTDHRSDIDRHAALIQRVVRKWLVVIHQAQAKQQETGKIHLRCRQRFELWIFILVCVVLLLVGISSSYTVFVQRIQVRPDLKSNYLLIAITGISTRPLTQCPPHLIPH